MKGAENPLNHNFRDFRYEMELNWKTSNHQKNKLNYRPLHHLGQQNIQTELVYGTSFTQIKLVGYENS